MARKNRQKYLGDSPDSLAYAYEIVSYGKNDMTLRHAKQKTIYRLKRAGE